MSKRKFYLKYCNIPEWKNPSSVTSPSPLRNDWRPNQNYRSPFQLILFINPVLRLYSGHIFLCRYCVPSGTWETFFHSQKKNHRWVNQEILILLLGKSLVDRNEVSTKIHKRTPPRPFPAQKCSGNSNLLIFVPQFCASCEFRQQGFWTYPNL